MSLPAPTSRQALAVQSHCRDRKQIILSCYGLEEMVPHREADPTVLAGSGGDWQWAPPPAISLEIVVRVIHLARAAPQL